MMRIDESGWWQLELEDAEFEGGGIPHLGVLMTDKRLQYRKLIGNMRKMEEAGHLVRCPICGQVVLTVNTKNGTCTYHQLNED